MASASLELAPPRRLPYRGWVQAICPAAHRLVQRLILERGLATGLDIGCGESSVLTPLRAHGFRSVGLDAWPQQVERARARNLHDEYLVGDIQAMELNRAFDVVVLNHVIEHLTRDAGMELLRRVEATARRLVVIGTPNGFLEQTAFDGNPFQRHLSGWFPHDFESRGYTVFGGGLRLLRGPVGRAKYLPEPCIRTAERLTAWYVFRRPGISHSLTAVRYQDEDGSVRQL